jgi:hypothetical protein
VDFKLELWNRIDDHQVSLFMVPICAEVP